MRPIFKFHATIIALGASRRTEVVFLHNVPKTPTEAHFNEARRLAETRCIGVEYVTDVQFVRRYPGTGADREERDGD
jgi:hypothetical protein